MWKCVNRDDDKRPSGENQTPHAGIADSECGDCHRPTRRFLPHRNKKRDSFLQPPRFCKAEDQMDYFTMNFLPFRM